MRYRYFEWDDSLFEQLQQLKDLLSVFNYILLQVNGDVEKAFDVLDRLQEMGYIPKEWDLEKFRRELENQKVIKQGQSGMSLTRKGERGIRKDAFEHVFQNLKNSGYGQHNFPVGGGDSEEQLPEKRKYDFGDDFKNLDLTGSLLNTVGRTGSFGMNMAEDDLEVHDTAKTTSAATVILIDISHSMILYGEDRITPAKQVAMAFTELIKTKYPRDSLNIVTFGNDAKEVKIEELPYLSVGPFYTNTKAGLQMARNILLRRNKANKQIFMITDGKPSLVRRKNGRLYRNPVGLDPIIVNRTLDEAVICRKKKISITTFMITEDEYLKQFVVKLTELNRGRAYFANPQDLGNYVFWDFLNHRRKRG